MKLRAATRGSPLAIWQTNRVIELLMASQRDIEIEVVVVQTTGDLDQSTPIEQMAGRGVFVKEVQTAVLDGRADIAVHSAKDLMSSPPRGLFIAAFPERADVRDCLVGSSLDDLREGAVVATGSIRRKAQLAGLRPDLQFVGLRGNMTTRLAKLDSVDAIVAASAGLDRLGLHDRITERLDVAVCVPQVAQGALAVECRSDDAATLEAIGAIDSLSIRRTVSAERAYLGELGGGCDLPVGAIATLEDDVVVLDVVLAAMDGSTILRTIARGSDPELLGRQLALQLLNDGGAALLAAR